MTAKFFKDARLIFVKSLRESRRDPAIAYVFPMVPPLFFAVLAAVTYSDVIDLPGFPTDDYIVWIASGAVFLPAMVGAGFTATSTILDAQSGYLDRLRLLPVSPSSVIAGRLAFDALRVMPATAAVLLATIGMGAQVRTGFAGGVLLFAMVALMALAWNGVFYVAALRSMNPQTPMAMQPMFLPFLFLSTIYMPKANLPGWVQDVAKFNPLDHMANAARDLMIEPFEWGQFIGASAITLGLFVVTLAGTLRIWSRLNTAD